MKLWSGPHTTHARGEESYIVKLDAAMRWYQVFMDGSQRRAVKVGEAAKAAYDEGMEVFWGLPGGYQFEKKFEALEAAATGKKRCSTCREPRPIEDFPQHGTALLGRNSRCSGCLSEYRKRFREGTPAEEILDRQAAYRAGNREGIRRSQAAFRDRHRDVILEQARIRSQQHPEMRRAHRKVRSAIEKGVLVRPDSCSRCGREGKIQASHDDYFRPIDIEWLCQSCHVKKDRANPLARLGPEYSLSALKALGGGA